MVSRGVENVEESLQIDTYIDISTTNENTLLDTDADTVCNMCFAEFLDAHDLHTHILQVHLTFERSQRFCVFCVKIFSDIEQFMLHIRNKHLCHLKWCEHCFRLFPDLKSKMLHEKKHKYRPNGAIYCSQCSRSFDTADIAQHEYEDHDQSGDGMMINHSLSIMSSLLNMNVKSFFKTTSESGDYICTHCQSSYSNVNDFINHLKTQNFKSFTCDICCSVFSKKRFLFKHIKKHNKPPKYVTCLKCNENFTRKALKIHQMSCSFLKCLVCDVKFQSVQHLAEHTSLAHNEAVAFDRCKFCDKHLIGDDMMKKHIKNCHKGTLHLYKYVCIDCDRVFIHPKKLFGHFFSTHKELKPYFCKICNMNFRIRKKFTLHVRLVHNNVGFVEFDENFHVYFVETKSENPFVPKSIYFDSSDDDTVENSIKLNKSIKKQDIETSVDDDCTYIDTSQIENNETVKAAKRKRRATVKITSDSSDSDVPLLKLRKQKSHKRKGRGKKKVQHKFMCTKCHKNCYTSQNFQHHMNLHAKRAPIDCIKCENSFKSEKELKKHIEEHHSNSVLTETLKKVKERRKTDIQPKKLEIANKFRVTLKKVDLVHNETPAKLTLVKSNKKNSVRNFFESFVPDMPDKLIIHSSATLSLTAQKKKPTIVFKKCNLAPIVYQGLKMPMKFVDTSDESPTVSIKVVHGEKKRANLNFGEKIVKDTEETPTEDHSYCEEYNYDYDNNTYTNNYEYATDDDTNVIPDVAEEVMLATEETRPILQEFILPDMPKVMKSFRIGTLQTQAPYYKIVKIEDIVQKPAEVLQSKNNPVKLPDGMQLVPVNPLAHLLKEDIHQMKNPKKYYKTKDVDIKEAIMKSMQVKPRKIKRKSVFKSKVSYLDLTEDSTNNVIIDVSEDKIEATNTE